MLRGDFSIIHGVGVYLENVKLLSLIYSLFLMFTLLYRFIGISYLKRETKLFIKEGSLSTRGVKK